MASFQEDFLKFNTPSGTYGIITRYIGSSPYLDAQTNWEYFNGNNTTIGDIERFYYSEGTKDSAGKLIAGTSGLKVNYWSANNKIGYSFFKDMVTQKVDTLFRETPTIQTDFEIDKKFIKNFGFALRVAAERASAQKYAFLLTLSNEIQVFAADRAIPFYDDDTGEIRALIRWWTVERLNSVETLYWEIYEEDGVTTCRNKPSIEIVKPKMPYRYIERTSAVSVIREPKAIGKLPINEFRNTYDRRSDMTPNIRAKIDIIDIVQSGFANNIEDFSDVFLAIKSSSSLREQDYIDFLANFSQTHVAKMADVEMKQFQVPTEARSKFVEIMKADLVRDGGVMDMDALLRGNATATAIRVSRANLETRVSAFEWTAYEAATSVIETYKRVNGLEFDFDVAFNKYTLNNDTEVISNANQLYGRIPDEDYFRMLQSINVISTSPDEAIQKMNLQTAAKYGAGGGLDG